MEHFTCVLKNGVFMMINAVAPKFHSSYCPMMSCIDSEEKAIMDKLLSYGCTPTGDKATDRAHLRRIEEEKAKQDNYVSNKYLTVSAAECQKIQDRKKETKKISGQDNTSKLHEERKGATLMGEQIFLAIKMNNKKLSENDKNKKTDKIKLIA